MFELAIPTNTQQHLLAARAWKEDRYGSLLQAWGDYRRTVIDYDCDYFAFCYYDYDYCDL